MIGKCNDWLPTGRTRMLATCTFHIPGTCVSKGDQRSAERWKILNLIKLTELRLLVLLRPGIRPISEVPLTLNVQNAIMDRLITCCSPG